MPLILPGNVASATASTTYTVDNSCRFDGTNDYMVRSATGNDTESNNKWTFSCWVKRAKLGAEQMILDHRGSGNQFNIRFTGNDSIQAYDYVGGNLMQRDTNAEYRDPSAWYHILWSSDRSIGSPTTKLWVNGTEVTSWATSTEYSQDDTAAANQDYDTWIGGENPSGSRLGAYLAEVVWLDGTFVSDATDFGEFDEDSPTIWKPKDVSGLTFGTNGFYFDFEDSANLGNDANGGTDFTEANIVAADQSTDSPTNNFCTLNSLHITSEKTFSQGNTTYTKSGSWHRATLGTIAPSNGKWYFEFKNNNDAKFEVAVCNETLASDGRYFDDTTGDSTYALRYSNEAVTFHTSNGSAEMMQNNTQIRDDVGQIASGDIGMIAFDCTTGKLWTGREGTWDNSGDPAAGSDPSVTWSTNFTANQTTYFGFGQESGQIVDVNFGGVAGFGGTAVSSANADGNGYGAFEFSVPSGFYALCTKNLAEYG